MNAGSRAVIFDYGNVLGRSSSEWRESIAREFGMTRSQWAPIFWAVETSMGGREFSSSDMISPLADRLRPMVRERATELAQELVRTFTDTEVNRPMAGALDLLRELKASEVQIGVLSNGPADSAGTIMKWLDEFSLVDASVLSGREGVGKPQAAAFDLVLERLGVAAASAWFVDDNPAHVASGERHGIRSIRCDGDVDKLRADLRAAGLDW